MNSSYNLRDVYTIINGGVNITTLSESTERNEQQVVPLNEENEEIHLPVENICSYHVFSQERFVTGFSQYQFTEFSDTIEEEDQKKPPFHDVIVYHVPSRTKYACHRLILAYHSKFFEMLFCSYFKEAKSAIVEVHFEDPDSVFSKFIEFLYKGEVYIAAEQIVSLHIAADQFQCPLLSAAVIKILDQYISNQNVFDIMTQCLRRYDDAILEQVIAYIARNFIELADQLQAECLKLSPDLFFKLIYHNNLIHVSCEIAKRNFIISSIVNIYVNHYKILDNNEMLIVAVDSLTNSGIMTADDGIKYMVLCDEKGLFEQAVKCAKILAAKFIDTDVEKLIRIMKPKYFNEFLRSDELVVSSEDDAYRIAVRYIEQNAEILTEEEKRETMGSIRLTFLSYPLLQSIRKDEKINQYIDKQTIIDALWMRIIRLELANTEDGKFKEELPTLCPRTTRIFIYNLDFDEKGVLYWLGTYFGSEKYMDPVVRGLVNVTHSCNLESGQASNLISRTPVSCNLVSQANSSVTIEFRNLLVHPTKYTLRHTAARDAECLRNWTLEGSIDGSQYEELIRHVNDKSLQGKSATHSWDLDPDKACNYYRFFRITQTGQNSSNNLYLSMAGFEIYGHAKQAKKLKE